MLELTSPPVMAAIGAILLGTFGCLIRWLANFQLGAAGSDFAFAATSLQLSKIFIVASSTESTQSGNQELTFDILLFLILLIMWGTSLKVVRVGQTYDRRILKINPCTIGAFAIGAAAIVVEVIWRAYIV